MFRIEADPTRQQLNIIIRNVYDAEDLKTIRFLVLQRVSELQPGFTVAVDLRNMRVLEQRLTHYISQIQSILVDHEAGSAATLVDNTILKMQMQRLGAETGFNRIVKRFSDERAWRAFLAMPPEMRRIQGNE